MLKISLFFHLVAAMFWIGGMLFLTLVVAPFLKATANVEERSLIYQAIGKSFRFWGWIAIAILVSTGVLNLYFMGFPFSLFADLSYYSTPYGKILALKISVVLIIIVTSFLHDFILGPMARSSRSYSTFAKWMGRSNLIIALIIVLFAVYLRFGGIR